MSIPKFQNKTDIAHVLGLPLEVVSEILDFLEKKGLAKKSGNQFKIGTNRIHLGKNSPMISRHHGNWRTKALQSLDKKETGGTHFSVVMGISKQDVEKVRSILLNAMVQTEKVIQETNEETLYCLGIDLFGLIA